MYCPDCGTDAGEAKFCPECGADLGAFRDAKVAGTDAGTAGAKPAAKNARDAKAGTLGPQPKDGPSSGPSARLIWGLIAAVAVVVVAVVLFSQYGTEGGTNGGTTTGDGGTSAPVTAVEADTSGSYAELVERANALFDEGDKLFNQNQIEQGAEYFVAAAAIYAAAWDKKPGDPNVGTDWATALFYSGDLDGAVKQIDAVLEVNPEFQTGWFNKGNYLAHQARITESMGDAKAAKEQFDEARQAYMKAVALDPKSDIGKEADSRLEALAE